MFRSICAVFSFGPADNIVGYGSQFFPFDLSNPNEFEIRSPTRWLASIQSPVFVFEGTLKGSNTRSMQILARNSTNSKIHFLSVQGASHFSILAPTTRLVATKILRDDGDVCNVAFTEEELSGPFRK